MLLGPKVQRAQYEITKLSHRPRRSAERLVNYIKIYIIKVTVCVCACVFSIGGHTVGPTELKFGMEDHIYPREVIGYILFPNTYPPGGGRPKSGSGDPCSPNGAFL